MYCNIGIPDHSGIQYGIMRAVGMDGVQVTRMIAAEAVTYGVTGLIWAC